jgi:DNA invertase Pin-like site-specific DNA recombinase
MNTPEPRCAVAYLRTSSASNVGADKDSEKRQRVAISEYAGHAGYEVRQEFYDAAVSGADAVDARTGFRAMLAWCDEHDCRTIIVENASRFARDLIVQETGYQMLKAQGFTLIAADDPDAFTASTPTQDLIRQVLGAVAQFEKANLVAKLRAARDRKSAEQGRRIEGPKKNADHVAAAKRFKAEGLSLRQIAARMEAEGMLSTAGTKLTAAQVSRLLAD